MSRSSSTKQSNTSSDEEAAGRLVDSTSRNGSLNQTRSLSTGTSSKYNQSLSQSQATMPLGITLSQIHEFIVEICGGRQELRNMTCGEVKDQFILPLCTTEQKSYVDILMERDQRGSTSHTSSRHQISQSVCMSILSSSNGSRKETLGSTTKSDCDSTAPGDYKKKENLSPQPKSEAIMMVCHGMDDLFLEFIDGLDHYFENDPAETAEDMMLWIDMFCFNYYDILHYEDPIIIYQWLTKLDRMFHRYGNTLVILAPWDSRSIFESPFCLYQLSVALEEQFLIDFSISKYEEDRLSRMFFRECNQHSHHSHHGPENMIASSMLMTKFCGQPVNLENYSQEGIHFPLKGLQILSKDFICRGGKGLTSKSVGSCIDDESLQRTQRDLDIIKEEQFRFAMKQTLQKWFIDLTKVWLNPNVGKSFIQQHGVMNQVMHEYHHEDFKDEVDDQDIAEGGADDGYYNGSSPTTHASLSRVLSKDSNSMKAGTQQIIVATVNKTVQDKEEICFRGWREEERCYLKVIDQVQLEMDEAKKELEYLQQQQQEQQQNHSSADTKCNDDDDEETLSSSISKPLTRSPNSKNSIAVRITMISTQLLDSNRQLCKYYHELYLLYMHQHFFADAETMLLQLLELQQFQQTSLSQAINVFSASTHVPISKKVSSSEEYKNSNDNESHDSEEQALEMELSKCEESILSTILKLAKLCVVQKKIQMAELFYQSYLNKVYGDDDDKGPKSQQRSHINVKRNTKEFILILQNIANFYYAQSSYLKAMPLFEDCYELSKQINGYEHLTTLHSASMLANTYVHMQLEEKAIQMARECVVIATAIHGHDSVHVSQYETNYIRIVENKLVKRVEEEVMFAKYQQQQEDDLEYEVEQAEYSQHSHQHISGPMRNEQSRGRLNPFAAFFGGGSSGRSRNHSNNSSPRQSSHFSSGGNDFNDMDHEAVSFHSHHSRGGSRSHSPHHGENNSGYYSTHGLHPTFGGNLGVTSFRSDGNSVHSTASTVKILSSPFHTTTVSAASSVAGTNSNSKGTATSVCVIC